MSKESYTPRTWRTHPLHLLPPETYTSTDSAARATLDWIFMISALNFSFWSELEGTGSQYGVEWWKGWGSSMRKRVVHTGYWSLVAAINKGGRFRYPADSSDSHSSQRWRPGYPSLTHSFTHRRQLARMRSSRPYLNTQNARKSRYPFSRSVSLFCGRLGTFSARSVTVAPSSSSRRLLMVTRSTLAVHTLDLLRSSGHAMKAVAQRSSL
jgi:hypothetical protein